MLQELITSKTRVKILLKFFLNQNNASYLRGLEHDLRESSNAIRLELNKLEELKLLISYMLGNKKYYKANTEHPLFFEIQSMVHKEVGIDQIVIAFSKELKGLKAIFLNGSFAAGMYSKIIDLVLVGENLDLNRINKLLENCEVKIKRRIRYITLEEDNLGNFFEDKSIYQIWSN